MIISCISNTGFMESKYFSKSCENPPATFLTHTATSTIKFLARAATRHDDPLMAVSYEDTCVCSHCWTVSSPLESWRYSVGDLVIVLMPPEALPRHAFKQIKF